MHSTNTLPLPSEGYRVDSIEINKWQNTVKLVVEDWWVDICAGRSRTIGYSLSLSLSLAVCLSVCLCLSLACLLRVKVQSSWTRTQGAPLLSQLLD